MQVDTSIQSQWREAKSVNTIYFYKKFLERNPEGAYADSARTRLYDLYFKKATDIISLQDFIEKYPEGAYADSARTRLDLYFKKATDIISLQDFLKKYPEGTYTEKARLRLKEVIKDIKILQLTTSSWSWFIEGEMLEWKNIAKLLLERAGIEVVTIDSQYIDTKMKIDTLLLNNVVQDKYHRVKEVNATYVVKMSITFSNQLVYEDRDVVTVSFNIKPGNRYYFISVSEVIDSQVSKKVFYHTFISALEFFIESLWGVKPLSVCLKDDDAIVRASAAEKLGQIKNYAYLAALHSATIDKNENVRSKAILAIKEIRQDPKTIERLIECLRVEKWAFGSSTKLKYLTGKEFGQHYDEWLHWWEDNKTNWVQFTKESREIPIDSNSSFEVKSKVSSKTVQTSDKLLFMKPPPSWPDFSLELAGDMVVRIKNPNSFEVRVGLRSDGKGRDFIVPHSSSKSVDVPNGIYEIYFQYSNDPSGIYQGDSFVLDNNGVEIQITEVINGNYSIRKIK